GRRSTEARWHQVVTTAKKLQFTGIPELVGKFQGDARDFKSFDVDLRLLAPGVNSPWGSGTNLSVSALLFPPIHSNEIAQAHVKLMAEDAHTPWGDAALLQLDLDAEPSYTQ